MTRHASQQTPIWCGIHCLLYLRRPGAERDSARLSLFQTEYCAGGAGHAAFLHIDSGSMTSAPANAVYTDNPELAAWLHDAMYRGRDNPLAECGDTVITARFGRSGDMRRRLCYAIDAPHCQIAASWAGLEPPFVHHGQGGNSSIYTYCFFVVAARASLEIDGRAAPGDIYDRQDWIPLVGRPLSSCLIADEFWTTQ